MGYEFKIMINLEDSEKNEIENIFRANSNFVYQDNAFWAFRAKNNISKMPDLHLFFEKKEIYICQNNSSNVWNNLFELKIYLEDFEYQLIEL